MNSWKLFSMQLLLEWKKTPERELILNFLEETPGPATDTLWEYRLERLIEEKSFSLDSSGEIDRIRMQRDKDTILNLARLLASAQQIGDFPAALKEIKDNSFHYRDEAIEE